MPVEELVKKVIEGIGGKENVLAATNCSTRLRIDVKEDCLIHDEELKGIEGVLAVLHDKSNYVEVVVGPGIVRQCADVCAEMGIPATKQDMTTQEKVANKSQKQKYNSFKCAFKTIGEIFVPLLPAAITAGLCAGMNEIIVLVCPNYANHQFLYTIWNILTLVSTAFFSYMMGWVGYRAAERFGATPILGGVLGMLTNLSNVDDISKTFGLYNDAQPLSSILRAGRGGIIAVILGVWILSKIEKEIRKKMPDNLDLVFTPFLTLFITVILYLFLIMPITGLVSGVLCKLISLVCLSDNVLVRGITGFTSAALFLPMVSMGMHRGLDSVYSLQLSELGYITLFPALAMAGAGQVGAAIAIYFKAKKCNNIRLQKVIKGAVPAGVLGIGEPLIYGVTLPMGRPFFTAGIGAGVGGAFVMIMQVGAKTWGTSGILGTLIMTAGKHGAYSMLYYVLGLLISCVMGFLITHLTIKVEDVVQV